MSSYASRQLSRILLAGVAVSGLSVNHAAADAPAVQAASDEGGIAEIIVTATRRSESLQKVPVAVQVIDGEIARMSNLNNIADIATIAPSLNFRTAASSKDQAVIIRGIGTISTSPGVEPSVSTVVDGVVLARQGQATLDLLDVDHIEILRGPQGTLFGKNASAGVVNIVTKNPTDQLHGFADVFYATGDDEKRLTAGVSGPVVPGKVAASANMLLSDYHGNVTNVYNGQSVNGYNRKGARAKILFTPTEDLTFLVGVDYMHAKSTAPTGAVARTYLTAYPTNIITQKPKFALALLPVVASEDNQLINSNYDTYAIDKNYGASLQVDWKTGNFTLTSITAYRKWDNTQYQDQDRLPRADPANAQLHDVGYLAFNQFSQELRLASPKGGMIDYVVGAYFMRASDDESYHRETTTMSAAIPPVYKVSNGVADYSTTNKNLSAFGEINVNFTNRFRGIVGGRVIYDDLDYHFNRVVTSTAPGIQAPFTSSGSTKPTGYADRLGLQFDITDQAMGYATYSRGYKGPAYNLSFSMLPQDTPDLKPETNNSFELGLKSRFFDNKVQANISGFYTKVKNFQVNFFDTYNGSPVTRLINAGQVSTRGVEADIMARPVPALTLTANGAYIKARIDDFVCPVGTNASCQVNGMPLPFSPDWKMNFRGNYTIPLSSGIDLDLTTDVTWQSKVQYSINQTPDTIQPAYAIWNAGASISTDSGFRFSAIVKNITDKHYSTTLGTFGGGIFRYVPRDDHRYVGVSARKEF